MWGRYNGTGSQANSKVRSGASTTELADSCAAFALVRARLAAGDWFRGGKAVTPDTRCRAIAFTPSRSAATLGTGPVRLLATG